MAVNEIIYVKKAQRGDEDAYIQLFKKHEAQLYRTAYLYVRNEEDALDIVQETAYRSFKALKSLKNPALFQTWLVRICITCSLDLLRKNKNIVYMEDFEEIEKAAFLQGVGMQQSQGIQGENRVDIMDMLSCLEPEEKSIVLLKYYYDYTFETIGEMLKIPVGTAKTKVYGAMRKLRIEVITGE